jgi:hypothetical protein
MPTSVAYDRYTLYYTITNAYGQASTTHERYAVAARKGRAGAGISPPGGGGFFGECIVANRTTGVPRDWKEAKSNR